MMDNILGFVVFTIGCYLTDARLKLSIIPFGKDIIVTENDDLNLTCKVTAPEVSNNVSLEISWNLPIKKSNSGGRISIYEGFNERSITVRKLQESDTGPYICEVNDAGGIQRQKVSVHVKTEKSTCSKPFFACGRGLCIPWHYVCDGYKDCPDGSDESVKHCGYDPCEGKFLCDDRCIPTKLCCDPSADPNCSVNYLMPCCHRLYNAMLPVDIVGYDGHDNPIQHKYHNIGFYQSTVYTMISCAIAFIFMSTVMLIAVCRFRIRRTPWFLQSSRPTQHQRFWRNSGPQMGRRVNTSTLQDATALSLQSYQSEVVDPLENFVLLTYDSSTGFEVAEYGPKPPPYTESNVGIPPPPYSSTIDMTSESTNPTEEPNQSSTNANEQ